MYIKTILLKNQIAASVLPPKSQVTQKQQKLTVYSDERDEAMLKLQIILKKRGETLESMIISGKKWVFEDNLEIVNGKVQLKSDESPDLAFL